jgi:zinc/manganese transport system substrate-binding protein
MLPELVPASATSDGRPAVIRSRTVLCCLAATWAAASCSSSGPAAAPEASAAGAVTGSSAPGAGAPCPVAPVPVVVSVDQWGDLVTELGGRCATVTTIISGSTADPHDYEPSPADVAAFAGARLVVVNGLGYDSWASAAAGAVSPAPAVVVAADVAGAHGGDNPHRWYSPPDVEATARAVTAELRRLLPGADGYLDERATGLRRALAPYNDLVAAIRDRHAGRAFAATEPVFDLLGAALGIANGTPAGYAAAAANDSDPAPGDIAAFGSVLRDGRVDVLVYNVQTQGAVPEQLREAAGSADVPVVEVTETVPPGRPSFVAWQVDQLERLDRALSGSR